MSFDLTLLAQRPLRVEDVRSFFQDRLDYDLGGNPDKGYHAVYSNPDTGVYFWFEFGDSKTLTGPDKASSGTLRRIAPSAARGPKAPLRSVRFFADVFLPYPFALEAAPEIASVQKQLGLEALIDEDVIDIGTAFLNARAFVEHWNDQNWKAYRAAAAAEVENPGDDRTVEAVEVSRWFIETLWRWNFGRRSAQELVSEELGDIFVPKLGLYEIERRPARACVWVRAIPIAFPDTADYVLLTPRPDDEDREMKLVKRAAVEPFIDRYARRLRGIDADILVYRDLYDPPPDVLEIFDDDRGMPPSVVSDLISFEDLIDAELMARARAEVRAR